VPFAAEHFSSMWLAFPASDYYGTADFLLPSPSCMTPVTGSQTFLNLYPYDLMIVKPLGRYLTPGKSNHALNHSYRMIPTGIPSRRVR